MQKEEKQAEQGTSPPLGQGLDLPLSYQQQGSNIRPVAMVHGESSLRKF